MKKIITLVLMFIITISYANNVYSEEKYIYSKTLNSYFHRDGTLIDCGRIPIKPDFAGKGRSTLA